MGSDCYCFESKMNSLRPRLGDSISLHALLSLISDGSFYLSVGHYLQCSYCNCQASLPEGTIASID